MKRWVKLASYFYPGWWRRRYAAEFHAMLDQSDANWKDFFDTLKGAITMQFTSWNGKSIALTFAVVGAMIAAAIAFSTPNQYSSSAVIRLTPGNNDKNLGRRLGNVAQEAFSRTFLAQVIVSLGLYKDERSRIPMEDVISKMRSQIDLLSKPTTPGAFTIRTTYPDPRLAQAINYSLVGKFIETVPRTGKLTGVQLVAASSLPQRPASPPRAAITFAGLCAGLLMGLVVAYAMNWRIVIIRKPAH
jgi:uncharacterized protein involved in exopolysaccharide biosynthesis